MPLGEAEIPYGGSSACATDRGLLWLSPKILIEEQLKPGRLIGALPLVRVHDKKVARQEGWHRTCRVPELAAFRGCRARRNLRIKRLNTKHILDHVLAVTFEYTPSNIRMLSTDKDVTAHVGAWIVVSARRIAGGQTRELVGLVNVLIDK